MERLTDAMNHDEINRRLARARDMAAALEKVGLREAALVLDELRAACDDVMTTWYYRAALNHQSRGVAQ
jgi:hypothetical protein